MSTEPANAYVRRLSTWDAAMIVIGGVIGAGIFRNPATIAQQTTSGLQVLVLWVIGGLLTLCGVLCYAELGARRPQAGGTYVYLREAFGQLPGVPVWLDDGADQLPRQCRRGGRPSLPTTCGAAIGLPEMWVKPAAAGSIAFIVGINLFGIRAGAWGARTYFHRAEDRGDRAAGGPWAWCWRAGTWVRRWRWTRLHPVSSWAFVGALLPVLFTYGGFHYLNDLAGEVRNPQRTLPRALGMGMAGVVICYVLVNFAYLAGLGHAGLAASHAPAADLMRRLFGESGAKVIAVGIACSAFGYCNIAIAGGARVLQTMGADGMFFRAVGRIDPRTRAPQIALAALGAWAIVLTLSGSFGQLLDYTTVGEWLAHVFGIATLFWYRRHFFDQPSPYRVPFYPLLPLVFVITVFSVIVATAIHTPGDAGMSLLIIALGVPAYYGWRRVSRLH